MNKRGLSVEEVVSKNIRKGCLYDISWAKPLETLKKNPEAQGVEVFKVCDAVGQFGVDFSNKTTVEWEQYNAEHERGEVPEHLKFEWIVEDVVARYIKSGTEFLRLNTTENTNTKVSFVKVKDGIETVITREEAIALCGAKAKPSDNKNDSGCLSIPLKNITSFARNH